MTHHYKKWPLEGKKNETADKWLKSGFKPTLCHPRRPRDAQHGSACNGCDNLRTWETPGYDAGACISCLGHPVSVSWPM
jgi:hypothetical protein